VYLLDDPLSAVDIHVGTHLFEHCIRGHLAGKTRILTTHQLFCLKEADLVVVMQNGRITQQGSYAELVEAGLCFGPASESQRRETMQNEPITRLVVYPSRVCGVCCAMAELPFTYLVALQRFTNTNTNTHTHTHTNTQTSQTNTHTHTHTHTRQW
jgi:ABC-type sulfate/molybdate transport systems ATPase subunit